MNNFSLIFVRNLKAWPSNKIMMKIISKIQNYFEIILYIKKKFSSRYGTYFIIKVNNHKNDLDFFNVLYLLRKEVPVTSKIIWSLYNKLRNNGESKKSNNIDVELNPMVNTFFSNHLNSSSSFFNFCVSWNINGLNTKKSDIILWNNSIFKPVCICLQETGKSKHLPKEVSLPLIPHYKSVFLRANPKTPWMRGFFIGIHSFALSSKNLFLYKYIISVTITSFWNQNCTIVSIFLDLLVLTILFIIKFLHHILTWHHYVLHFLFFS